MEDFSLNENTLPGLSDYPFQPFYADVESGRMHYIDQGPKDAPVVLLLHGVPTWSYLYRKMIYPLEESGFRVIAPDLIGFGLSDKPADKGIHTCRNHVDWMTGFITKLNLNHILLFGQDWGAIIGMTVAAEMPERFSGLILSNGLILTGEEKLPLILKFWKMFSRYSPWLPVGELINFGCKRRLTRFEKRAYRAPFRKSSDFSGIRSLPSRIPDGSSHPAAEFGREAWEKLIHFNKPVLTLFSNSDPFTRGGDRIIQERIPGAIGQKHRFISGGHFIQEDAPEDLVNEILNFSAGCYPGISLTVLNHASQSN